jgi:hypothetical protein
MLLLPYDLVPDSCLKHRFNAGIQRFNAFSREAKDAIIEEIISAGKAARDEGKTLPQCRFACYRAFAPGMKLPLQRGVRYELPPELMDTITQEFGDSVTGFRRKK